VCSPFDFGFTPTINYFIIAAGIKQVSFIIVAIDFAELFLQIGFTDHIVLKMVL